jgi:predicted phosphodiesterase
LKTLVIGDIHFPFHSRRALAVVYKAIRRERPDVIAQMGDLLDQYVFSRYPRNLSYITPEEEVSRGLKEARAFWARVRRLAPRARCYQLIGNHDVRLAKRIAEKLPELKSVVNPLEMYQFPGVTTMKDDRAELRLNGMVFHHGYLSKLGDHAKQFMKPTVVGHSHRGGVVWHGPGLWELNAGFLADESLLPLNYGSKKTSNWTLGYGLIDAYGPRFIPITKKEAA